MIKFTIMVIYFSDYKIFQQEILIAFGDLRYFQPYRPGNVLDVMFYWIALKSVLKYLLKLSHFNIDKHNPYPIIFEPDHW